MTPLTLSAPDQHGCARLMQGDVQLAHVMPEGIETVQRWIELSHNVSLILKNSEQQRETFSQLVELMSKHRCTDENKRR